MILVGERQISPDVSAVMSTRNVPCPIGPS